MHKILVLGPQGSGKTTQAEVLSKKLGVPYFSMGQLLRDQVAKGGERAKMIGEVQKMGDLVPFEVVVNVLDERTREPDARDGYILDGFPRSFEQMTAFEKYDMPTAVLILDIPREESIARLTKRAGIEGRADDTPEAILKRLRVYDEETLPVLEHYKEKGMAYVVSGVGEVPEVTERVLQHFIV